MRKATLVVLALVSMALMAVQQARAAAPTFKLGCSSHGWIASGTTNTPFDGIIQLTEQYTSATTGVILGGKYVVNVGGAAICTYTIATTPSSVFVLNADGTTAAVENWAPAAGNPAGCATTTFTTHAQSVITVSGSFAIITDANGETGSGVCSAQ